MSKSKSFIGITIVGILLFVLLAPIAFMFSSKRNLEKTFSFALNRSIKTFCKDCSVSLSNFNLTSLNSTSFQINTALNIKTNTDTTSICSAKLVNLTFDLSKIFSEFSIPIKINVTSVAFNLDHTSAKDLNQRKLFALFTLFDNKKFLEPEILEIKNASLTLDKTRYTFDLKKTAEENTSIHAFTLVSAKTKSTIEVMQQKQNATEKTKYIIHNLPAKFITKIVPNALQNKFLVAINKNLFISGKVEINSSKERRAFNASFYNQTQEKSRSESSTNFRATLTSEDWNDKIQIKKLLLSLPEKQGTILAKGFIKYSSKLLGQRTSLSLSFNANKLNLRAASTLWPKDIASDTRNWVVDSVKDGQLANLKGQIYLKDIFSAEPNNLSFEGRSKFQNLNLNYMPNFPQIDSLAGTVNFNNSEVAFNVQEGKLLDASIAKGSSVKINLKDKNCLLTVKAKALGPIKDFISFIPEENIIQLKNKKIDLNNINGTADTSVTIKIPLSKDISLNNLGLDVDAKLTEVNFYALDRLKLQGSLTLGIHNHLLSITGTPLINKNISKFHWQTHLKDKMEFNNKLNVKLILDASKENVALLSDKIIISNGKIFSKVKYVGRDNDERITVSSNLDDPHVYIQDINLVKNSNKQLSFDLILINKNGKGWKTEKCDLISNEEDIRVYSYFELSNALDEVRKFDSTIQSKENNIIINLVLNKKEGKLIIHGNHITPNKNHLFQLLNSQDFTKNKKLSLQIKIDKATMKNGVIFKKILGKFECHRNVCKSSALTMKINDKTILNSKLKIYKKNGSIILRTNNAAALLKGFDTYKNIEGGNMVITFHPPKKNMLQRNQLKGDIYIQNFKAFKTPIIAQLLLMTPFTSIVEKLKGQDLITFKNVKGAFTITDNVIKLHDSLATGDLLSVTIGGYIDLKKQTLKLKGDLIPSCLINKFISSIQSKKETNPEKYPLATSYTISGNLNKPKVHVDPISILVSIFTKPLSLF